MKIFGLKINQIVLVFSGILLLVSLPWFGTWEVWLWIISHILIILGVILVIKNI
jgi:hypothetical protein